MRTIFTEKETKGLDSKLAAYVLKDSELRQTLVSDTEQSPWKTRDSIRTIPVVKPMAN